ncbi:reticulocyte-binding protein homolog 2a [Xyrauchen texanus]|uniref:reticulocyte-binding protein homolog 2a n=1 Tax=Xyrauchen texanus TaxID=154827 RepID=UPI002241DFC6|nr:reticulocyte-binding protein homolog 2a [Xyrauchen texanus]
MKRNQSPPDDHPNMSMFSRSEKHKLNLVLCGSDADLKTSVSKLIRGKKTSTSGQSSSSECVKREGEVCGRQITLVELPALSQLSEEEVMRQSLHCVSLCDPGVHVFLLIIPVGPLTDEERAEIEMIQKIFYSRDHFMVLFTSRIPVNEPLIDLAKSIINSQSLCGGRHKVMGLNKHDNTKQISELLGNIENMKTEPYSLQMYVRAQEKRGIDETEEKYKEELKRMENEIKELQEKLLRYDSRDSNKTGVVRSATGNTTNNQRTKQDEREKSDEEIEKKDQQRMKREEGLNEREEGYKTEIKEKEEQEREMKDEMRREREELGKQIQEEKLRREEEKENLKLERDQQEKQMNIMMERVETLNREREELLTKHEEEKERMKKMMEEERQNQEKENKRRKEKFREREEQLKREMKEKEEQERNMRREREEWEKQIQEEKLRREEEKENLKLERDQQEKQMNIMMERVETLNREREELLTKHEEEKERMKKMMEEERQNQEKENKRRKEKFREREEQLKREMKEKEEQERNMRKEREEWEKQKLKREEEFNEREERYKREIKEKEERERKMREMRRDREEWEKQKQEEKLSREDEEEKLRKREQEMWDEYDQRKEREETEREKILQSKYEPEKERMNTMENERQNKEMKRREFSVREERERAIREEEKLKREERERAIREEEKLKREERYKREIKEKEERERAIREEEKHAFKDQDKSQEKSLGHSDRQNINSNILEVHHSKGEVFSLAHVIKDTLSSKVKDGNRESPPIFKLHTDETWQNSDGSCRRNTFGKNTSKENKTIMMIGATGAGKTTLINSMINYIMGVEWEDDFRFVLIDEGKQKSQAESQTSEITAYQINHMDGFRVPYSLTIVDTPGFGDTRGISHDQKITSQIHEFFSQRGGIDHIDAVCFVVQASLARLTHTQSYIFDAILSIFGKDIAGNIIVLVTFADGKRPPVLEAIKVSQVPSSTNDSGEPLHFKFNNSAMFVSSNKPVKSDDEESDGGNLDQMFWKMGFTSLKKFFTSLNRMESKSLSLTQEVLKERKQLEVLVEGLQLQINNGLSKLDEIKKTKAALEQHEAEMKANKDFKYEVEVIVPKQIKNTTKSFLTNCQTCHYTCHDTCIYANDQDKYKCIAMKDGKCTVCPGKCDWDVHFNQKYKWVYVKEKKKETYQDLKKRFEDAHGEVMSTEKIFEQLEKEFAAMKDIVVQLIERSQKSLERLQEIALKPNPLSTPDYIDLMIESEKQQAKPGFQDRIQSLMEVRKRAEIISKVSTGDVLSDDGKKY